MSSDRGIWRSARAWSVLTETWSPSFPRTMNAYGKPIEMAATITADLPGGLAINGGVGRVTLMPAAGEQTGFRSRQRIVNPTGVVLAELGLITSYATGTEGQGIWHHSTDDSGTLTEELLIPADPNGTSRAKFTLATLAGRHASAVVDAVRFASHLTAPNRLHIASEFGPFYDFAAPATRERLADPALAQLVEDLATLQALTPVPIMIPESVVWNSATSLRCVPVVVTWS
jgi:hypothetical protein